MENVPAGLVGDFQDVKLSLKYSSCAYIAFKPASRLFSSDVAELLSSADAFVSSLSFVALLINSKETAGGRFWRNTLVSFEAENAFPE